MAESTTITRDKVLRELGGVISLLTPQNQETTLRVCYDAAKLIYYRQKFSGKPQLKPKEIAWCLESVYFHHHRDRIIEVKGALAENFGRPFSSDAAIDYYEHHVEGTHTDAFGNQIVIDELGLDFLYESHNLQGRYLEPRGKRLPWIPHTLTTSTEVYEGEENGHTQLYYVTHYSIPLRSPQPSEQSWFMVIVRKRRDKSWGFLTAFPIETYNKFLSKIAKWKPVQPINRKPNS